MPKRITPSPVSFEIDPSQMVVYKPTSRVDIEFTATLETVTALYKFLNNNKESCSYSVKDTYGIEMKSLKECQITKNIEKIIVNYENNKIEFFYNS